MMKFGRCSVPGQSGFSLAILCLLAVLAVFPAQAREWQVFPEVRARLVPAISGMGTLESFPVTLEIRLKPGWKTYWRSPGDAGLPLSVDWTESTNVDETMMLWPAPRRFSFQGISTTGYETAVAFPVLIRPEDPEKTISPKAKVSILVCEELCLPREFALALDLPPGLAAPDPEGMLLYDEAMARVPAALTDQADITETRVQVSGNAIQVTLTGGKPFSSPDVFLEAPGLSGLPEPQITMSMDGRHVMATFAPVSGILSPGAPVTITLVDGDRMAELHATAVGDEAPVPAPSRSLAAILGLAVLGGLILNVMPCVLPVLSLKLMAALRTRGKERRHVRQGFLATAAGIIISFLVLAAVAMGLKAAGASAGWGIQFQQPLFLVFLLALLVVFTASMAGLVEITPPRRLMDALSRGRHHEGLAGDFAAGLFATLMATPCSAPFLGTAVSFALAGSMADIALVFLALGTGMALPWLVVAAFPWLVSLLPRPGPWMVILRRILAAGLALTALWILSVLATVTGEVLLSLLLAMALVLALILLTVRSRGKPPRRPVMAVRIILCLVVVCGLAGVLHQAGRSDAPLSVDSRWNLLDEQAIPGLVEDGQVVFVDVTADWCVTCQVNERLVLERTAVADRIFGEGVTAMQADWTRPDPRIAAFLQRHGRYGIPFTMVYGPAAPDGIVLPELLTVRTVLDALDRAGRR
ncbi:MAG: thioredoxin family protein [Pseudomonadota bacterium]|nr:thioredoxin family protein [Pseudomonadota bacterium]